MIAALVGLVLMGIGHIYIGKIGRGILILAAGILARVALLYSGVGFLFASVAAGVLGILIVVLINIGLWIWQIYDAYALAKKYNAEVERTSKPPW